MYLLKIDHIVSPGSWDDPNQTPPEIESDYINLNSVVSITPIIDNDNYQLRIAFANGDNGIYDVPPWVYDNVLQWLDKAVVCDGGAG